MRIMLITPPQDRPSEHAWIEALLDAGVDRVHVRKPMHSRRELEAYLQPLVLSGWGGRIAVHRQHEVALACGVRQVHLPQELRHVAEEISGSVRLSTSAHSVGEVLSLSPAWEYAFLSPIFPSISKQGYSRAFDAHALQGLAARASCRLVALGGVDGRRSGKVRSWGWYGVAMLGAIWEKQTLREALAELGKVQTNGGKSQE